MRFIMFDAHAHPLSLPADYVPVQAMAGLGVTVHPDELQALRARLCHWPQGWRCAAGLHPWYADAEVDWSAFEQQLSAGRVDAMGEVGLDGLKPVAMAQQLAVFRRQLLLAKAYDLPVVLHMVRDAGLGLDCWQSVGGLRGLVHGCTGSLEQASQWVRAGCLIGVGLRVLDPRAKRLQRLVRELPLTTMLPETDAPWGRGGDGLASVPDAVEQVVAYVARVRGLDEAQLWQQMMTNWHRWWAPLSEGMS